ncbi:hypothetical protein MKW98_028219 [Papaver atlanticum]|uniref:CW-type domain-containing protein n=1 Tax=Papaver atlanticum TaxID=357466 RepID=A0AAD4SXH4_9MAGN|nr:hypothetical protein MKW98_028219 [Papaver atlanticum]
MDSPQVPDSDSDRTVTDPMPLDEYYFQSDEESDAGYAGIDDEEASLPDIEITDQQPAPIIPPDNVPVHVPRYYLRSRSTERIHVVPGNPSRVFPGNGSLLNGYWWITCHDCGKWRRVGYLRRVENLPSGWNCKMSPVRLKRNLI